MTIILFIHLVRNDGSRDMLMDIDVWYINIRNSLMIDISHSVPDSL